MATLGATASTATFPATAADVGADAAGAAATAASGAASALASHEADTTSVHGVANTANLYVAGGTDVAVADGGTGASTALAARANLGAASSAIRGLLPTGALYHVAPRWAASGNVALLSTGRMSIVMIEMDAGVTLTSISFLSGTTALSVGANQWFALFDSSRAKLRVTADDTSTAWAANSVKTLALSSTFDTTYSGIYFLGIMVKATTVPSLILMSAGSTLIGTGGAGGIVPIIGGNSSTGLTDPASCPDPAGAIAGGVGFPYAYVS